jgi:hypothetical protein
VNVSWFAALQYSGRTICTISDCISEHVHAFLYIHMHPIKYYPHLYLYCTHTPHTLIVSFADKIILLIFPMIPIERLVGGSLRCSQDSPERVKLTTWRGLYSWAGQSRQPLSRGGGNKKLVKTLTKLYGTSHTIFNSLQFSRQTHVIEKIYPKLKFCQHTDAQDASMHSPRITCINASFMNWCPI